MSEPKTKTITVFLKAYAAVEIEMPGDFDPANPNDSLWDKTWEKIASEEPPVEWEIDEHAYNLEYGK